MIRLTDGGLVQVQYRKRKGNGGGDECNIGIKYESGMIEWRWKAMIEMNIDDEVVRAVSLVQMTHLHVGDCHSRSDLRLAASE